MNRFILSTDPVEAAQMHCDKHVVKMILEEAQMLSTAHRVLDGTMTIEQRYVQGSLPARFRKVKRWVHSNPDLDKVLYQATHINHPCAVWSRICRDNYLWGYELLEALCKEYTHRYGKTHLVETKLIDVLSHPPHKIQYGQILTNFPQAMPDECKHEDSVEAYRKYYIEKKVRFAKWTNRQPPSWWPNS
jgi:hypothetical protein